ncbi:MAG: hypothetical protein EG823_04665 [Actinobacteria bacterium]|nr:hypothetical protein [Actinomycetota bacterium]
MGSNSSTGVGTMRTHTWTPTRRCAVIALLALAFALTLSVSAHAATPTQPTLSDVFPSGSDQVTLQWLTSTDADGHAITYEIYRAKVPITQSMITPTKSVLVTGPLATVSQTLSGSTWTAVVNADVAGGEVLDSYVWFYVVRAKDTTPAYSTISYAMSPNMHGYRTAPDNTNVDACQRCHKVHDAPSPPGILDRSSWLCYYCHGRADNNASATVGDRSTLHTKTDFYDYGNLPAGGSQHRSAKMVSDNQVCRACHTPHRAPYYFRSPDGTAFEYDPLRSFRMGLRVRTGGTDASPTYTYYSQNSASAESTGFCFACHGSASTNMDYVSVTGYAGTAGDHNAANYATAAHGLSGTTLVRSNDFGATRQNDLPRVQCLACHDKHASSADKLIDYRETGGLSQAALCYKCHSAAGSAAEGTKSVGDTNLAWNKRDVQAQFGKASKHPTAAGSGRWVPASGTIFSQTTQAEFASDTITPAGTLSTALTPGSVQLAQFNPTITPGTASYLFTHFGNAMTFDAYKPGVGWNQDNYDPIDQNTPLTGSTAVEVANKIYITAGNGTNTRWVYTPASAPTADSWAAASNTQNNSSTTNASIAIGSGVAKDAANSYVFYTRGGGNNQLLRWNTATDTWPAAITIQDNGTSISQGQGSAIAFAPGAATGGRLFLVNRNGGTAVNGRLYYLDSPYNKTGNQNFLPNGGGVQLTNSTNNAYSSSMAYFRNAGGTEYLMFIGRNTGNTAFYATVVGSLNGTPAIVGGLTLPYPFGANALADGCDLEWDGVNGGYLYATRGGANTEMYRIAIPATVGSNWGAWTQITGAAANFAAGSSMAFANATPLPYSGPAEYYRTGRLTTGDITPYASATKWGTVTWTERETLPGAVVKVKVEGYNSGTSTWDDLSGGYIDASGIDLSSRSVATYTKIRLNAELYTTDAQKTVTPFLDDWTVTGSWDNFEPGYYVDTPYTSFSQTTQAEFASDTITPAGTLSTALTPGSVQLAQFNPTITPGTASYLFTHFGNAMTFDAYKPGVGWNQDNYDPIDQNTPLTGSTAVEVANKIYITAGNGTNTRWVYTPASAPTADSWAAASNTQNNSSTTNASIAIGSGVAKDAANSYVFYTRGGGNNQLLRWNTATDTWPAAITIQDNGTSISQGQGSAIAFAPGAATGGRLFLVNRNGGTAVNGRLYYLDSPYNKTGNQNFLPNGGGVQLTNSTNNAYSSSMAYFRNAGGTEYLMFIGRNTGNTAFYATVVGSLNGTPAIVGGLTLPYPFGANALADGCDLEWDGVNGGYLYATRGGANTEMYRIAIPATVGSNWGAWTQITGAAANFAAGSSMAFANATPLPYSGPAEYYRTGRLTTGDITPYASATKWGTVTWTERETLPGAVVKVKVEGYNSGTSTWDDLSGGYIDASGIDLSSRSVATYTKIRLNAELYTTDAQKTVTPFLDDWRATSLYPVFVPSGSLTCANCHNVHSVTPGNADETVAANWWNMSRASDPDNTKNPAPSSPTDFCLKCHDSGAPAAAINATTLVPYTAAFSDKSAYAFFPGWDKTTTGVAFKSSGHYAATTANGKALCENCHDPHASDNARLTAWTRPAGVTWAGGFSIAGLRANSAAAATEERLCYNCHGDGTATYPRANGARNVYTDASATYKHAQGTLGTAGSHSDLESASAVAVENGNTTRHSECVDCHDPHAARGTANSVSPVHTQGSSVAGGALNGVVGLTPSFPQHEATPPGTTTPHAGNWSLTGVTLSPIRLKGGSGDFEAYLCFKCHSAAQSTIGTKTYTNQVLEFNPSNFSEHNVLGQTLGLEEAFTVGTTTYTWTKPADNLWLQTGWTSNSQLTCTDCHTGEANADPVTQARGPHGSSVAWIIDPDYPLSYRSATLGSWTTSICGKCHNGTIRGYNFVHSEAGHGTGYNCTVCHVGVPHGWKRPRLMAYDDDPAPYTGTQAAGDGLNGLRPHNVTAPGTRGATGWDTGDCNSGCYADHNYNIAGRWP